MIFILMTINRTITNQDISQNYSSVMYLLHDCYGIIESDEKNISMIALIVEGAVRYD